MRGYGMWQLLLLLMVCSTSSTSSTGAVRCAGDGECPASDSDDRPLRWRARPYRNRDVQRGGGPVRAYGGDYAVGSFQAHGFHGPVDDDDWDVLFTHAPQTGKLGASLPQRPSSHEQLVHHCTYFGAAGQKCNFARHTANVVRLFPERSGHHLRAFVISQEAEASEWKEIAREHPQKHWIVKPCVAGRSMGIELLRGEDVAAHPGAREATVAQEYLLRPYLWSGRKCHLRYYLLVTRWRPRGALLYDEGMVFRSRSAYAHQTPQLERDVFSAVSDEVEVLSHGQFWRYLEVGAGGDNAKSTVAQERVTKMLRDVLGEAVETTFGPPVPRGYNCFDLYGLDVMFDEQLRPYLLEINIGPNIWINGTGDFSAKDVELERLVKEPLVDQLVRWMALRAHHSGELAELDAIVMENEALRNFTRIF